MYDPQRPTWRYSHTCSVTHLAVWINMQTGRIGYFYQYRNPNEGIS